MSEIEKLYELAGVNKENSYYCDWNGDCPYPERATCDTDCPYWKIDKTDYPPFTAEKQIELIKWLSEHYLLEIRRIKDTHEYYIGFNGYKKRVWNATINFENTLAKLINNFWQELTEEEKQQVKGILE
jgi:hypothetical protein